MYTLIEPDYNNSDSGKNKRENCRRETKQDIFREKKIMNAFFVTQSVFERSDKCVYRLQTQ